jgi:D-aminoacyl-tRNA deacylase
VVGSHPHPGGAARASTYKSELERLENPSADALVDPHRIVRAVCQRVSSARVRVGGDVTGEIGLGMVVLLGVARADDRATVERLAGKTARLRIFADEQGRFDRSLLDVGGAALVISQFTLIADTRKGNRPSFAGAAPPEQAEPLYEHFCTALRGEGVPVETGVFGARMEVELVNDGPVTIVLD